MPPRLKVSPDSHVPLYAQIKDALRSGILDGRYPPHSRMPSESELQTIFDVSRITIRQALGDLQKEGLIFKVHGKGSFVSQPKAFQNITSLQGFAEAMSRSGHEIINRVVKFRFVPAPAEVAARLSLPEQTRVAEIHRVRLLNRSPVSYEMTYLPELLGRQLERADLVTRDIFLILENDCALPLGSADLAIDAVAAKPGIARALAIAAGEPLLRIERLTHDANGRPVDFEYLYFRGDTFQYRLRIDRARAASPARRRHV
ncbi:GntR family transcriptional regulator [Caballeronia concitans]|jgi:GntR family transcriptional regulator|uniref:GntR family transcriptional regulator n=1 Tax=Caballeronia concitans TaxID=1777133 RepID=A0A658R5D0_9BURK|nr:GntR family transcriptional regulator [Caballeronia concitans]KIG01333.1 transcriptional regulator, GntR family with UTRA sensor domain containing protein [Burkholderia sp. MR1]SAL50637.1 GntR family transcriptional regulator [Caballeronia concitans]